MSGELSFPQALRCGERRTEPSRSSLPQHVRLRPQRLHPRVKGKKYRHVHSSPSQRAGSKVPIASSLAVGSEEKITSLRIYNHKLVTTKQVWENLGCRF